MKAERDRHDHRERRCDFTAAPVTAQPNGSANPATFTTILNFLILPNLAGIIRSSRKRPWV
jgi:hypothetical protein